MNLKEVVEIMMAHRNSPTTPEDVQKSVMDYMNLARDEGKKILESKPHAEQAAFLSGIQTSFEVTLTQQGYGVYVALIGSQHPEIDILVFECAYAALGMAALEEWH